MGYVVGPGGESTTDIAVARLDRSGAPDTSFSGDGIKVFGIVTDQEDIPLGLALAANGDIVVAGYTVEVVGPDEFTNLFVARLIGDPPPMFVDGLESGDTTEWSVTVGVQ